MEKTVGQKYVRSYQCIECLWCVPILSVNVYVILSRFLLPLTFKSSLPSHPLPRPVFHLQP